MTKKTTIYEIDLKFLQKLGLLPTEYLVLMGIFNRDTQLIDVVFNTTSVGLLLEQGYLKHIGGINSPISYDNLYVTRKFTDYIHVSEEQGLAAIRALYPKAEIRNGQKVPLQRNSKGIEAVYKKTIGRDGSKLDRVLKGLEFMLNERTKAGNKAQFLPDLQVWLNQERWRFYEEIEEKVKTIDGGKFDINL